MSGRRYEYQLRAKAEGPDMDSLNVREKEAFMRGDKLVAVIRCAGGAGLCDDDGPI